MIGAGRRKVPRGLSARKSLIFAPWAARTPRAARSVAEFLYFVACDPEHTAGLNFLKIEIEIQLLCVRPDKLS